MQTKLGHLVFGINPENVDFYRSFFTFLGWQILYETEGMLGIGDSNGVSLWFGNAIHDVRNDYDGPGLNHVAVNTETQDEVDQAVSWLAQHDIPALFETPRHRPEFSYDENSTYYQVMFETPDHILMEVVYIGPKS